MSEQEFQNSYAPAAEGTEEPSQQTVSLEVVKAIREELKESKAKTAQLEAEMNIYRSNMTQNQTTTKEKEPDPFDGLDDDDAVSVAEVRKVLSGVEKRVKDALGQVSLQVQAPDLKEVLEKHTKPLIQANPALADIIKSSPNPYQTAYLLGKIYSSNSGGSTNATARKIEDNLNKPGDPGSAGGGGFAINKAKRYESMSDEDFEREMERIKRGG